MTSTAAPPPLTPSPPASTPGGLFAHLPAAFSNQRVQRWIFIGKTLFAALLALWISMRLDFEQPRTAMLTVFIVMQPKVGMVFAKNFYRAIATVIGVGAGLLLVSLFAQQEILFLGAMALWIGVCVFGAASYRNFRSYGFVLAGYTSAIVGLPAALQPDLAFDIALARLTEVMVGIFCAGIVSAAVFPLRSNEDLEAAMRRRYRDFLDLVAGVLGSAIDSAAGNAGSGIDRKTLEASLLKHVRDVVAFESTRDQSLFEAAEVRLSNRHLLWLNRRFMTASTSFHTLQRLIERLQRSQRVGALLALRQVFLRLAETLAPPGTHEGEAAESAAAVPKTEVRREQDDRADARATLARLLALRAELPPLIATARETLAATPPPASSPPSSSSLSDDAETAPMARIEDERVADFIAAAELLSRFVQELIDYLASYSHAPQEIIEGDPRFVPLADPLMAAISGLRAMLAIALLGAFWLLTGWPDGPGAMTLATVLCALFASAPVPEAAVRKMSLGLLIGFFSAFVCTFFVLTRLDDSFFMLCLAIAPFMIVGPWLAGSPKWSGIGGGYNIFMINGMALSNPMHFDLSAFINNGIAELVGAAVAGVIFVTLMPSGGAWQRRRWQAMLLRHAARACTARLAQVEARFGSGLHDIINTLGTLPLTPEQQRGLLDWTFVAYEAGRLVVDLRRDLRQTPLEAREREAVEAVVHAVGAFFERPEGRRHRAAAAAIDMALSHLITAARRAAAKAAEAAREETAAGVNDEALNQQKEELREQRREELRATRRRFIATLHLLRAAWLDPASSMQLYVASPAVPAAEATESAGGTHAA